MSTRARLAVFAAVLVAVFAGAVGIGRATGPVGPIGPADERQVLHAGDGGHGDEHAGTDLPGGLASSEDGLTLVLEEPTLTAGTHELAFRVEDAEGAPVTGYDVEHDERMHLVAVRRDFSGFQHVHPELDAAGTWRVPLDLTAGSWRVFADFVPAGGEDLTLGADLAVPGPTSATEPTEPTRTATVDGYTVTLDGDLAAGETSDLELTVSKDGEPVTDLEPYLGAYGHLVALREGDLAYLHVHPEDGPAGPTVAFGAEVPSAGRYHLYLDFQHAGVVRTAAFTVEAEHVHD
ncbi:MAG: hypothetical protein JWN84_1883 [Nocardioides sp.]|nr:hypothetical protein [Nocardioides sp.]